MENFLGKCNTWFKVRFGIILLLIVNANSFAFANVGNAVSDWKAVYEAATHTEQQGNYPLALRLRLTEIQRIGSSSIQNDGIAVVEALAAAGTDCWQLHRRRCAEKLWIKAWARSGNRFLYQADRQFASGSFVEAFQGYESLTASVDRSPFLLDEAPLVAHLRSALVFAAAGNGKEAASRLKQLMASSPDFAWARLMFADNAFALGEKDLAESEWAQILANHSSFFDRMSIEGPAYISLSMLASSSQRMHHVPTSCSTTRRAENSR